MIKDEILIELTCDNQVLSREPCMDRYQEVDGRLILSQAFRVYNCDVKAVTLPIAYVIQVWPDKRTHFIPAY